MVVMCWFYWIHENQNKVYRITFVYTFILKGEKKGIYHTQIFFCQLHKHHCCVGSFSNKSWKCSPKLFLLISQTVDEHLTVAFLHGFSTMLAWTNHVTSLNRLRGFTFSFLIQIVQYIWNKGFFQNKLNFNPIFCIYQKHLILLL